MEEFKFTFNALFDEINLIPDLYQYYQPKYSLNDDPITVDNLVEYIRALYDKQFIPFYYYTKDKHSFNFICSVSDGFNILVYENSTWIYTYNFHNSFCDCKTFQGANIEELLDFILKDYKINSYHF